MSATGNGMGENLKFDLQAEMDSAASGAVIEIPPDEYTGPFMLRKPVTLRGGSGTTLTSTLGPVVVVDSPGVVLEHLIVEVGSGAAAGAEGCALQVNSGNRPQTLDLRVKGSVIGVPGEEGQWNLPAACEFGIVTSTRGLKHRKNFTLNVPAACTLDASEIEGLEVTPSSLAPGANSVQFGIEVDPGVNIYGFLRICTPLVWRSVPVIGRAAGGGDRTILTPQPQLSTQMPVQPPPQVVSPPRPAAQLSVQLPQAGPASPLPRPQPQLSPIPLAPGASAPKPPAHVALPQPLPTQVAPVILPSTRKQPVPRPRWGRWFIAAAVLLAAVVGWRMLGGGFDPKALTPLSSLPSGGSTVTALAISADGKLVAEGSADFAVKLYDVQASERKWQSSRLNGAVRAIAFSPDGSLVACGDDTTVVLYAAATGEVKSVLRGFSGAVNALAFSPDGKRLAAGLQDSTVRIWDAATGEQLISLARHDGAVNAVAFSANGETLASGGDDNKLILWDANSGESKNIVRGFSGGLTAVALNAKGTTVAAGFADGSVLIWADGSPMPSQTLRSQSVPVDSLLLAPNGASVAAVSADGSLYLWQAKDGDLTRTLRGYGSSSAKAAVSANRKLLAMGGADGVVKLWKIE